MHNLKVSAYYIGDIIKFNEFENNKKYELVRKERNLLVFKLNEFSYISVFSYGVIAVLNEREADFTDIIANFCDCQEKNIDNKDLIKVSPEEYDVIVDAVASEQVDFDYIRIKDLSLEKVLLILRVAAQSVAIEYLENDIDKMMRRFDEVHTGLSKRGKLIMNTREVLRIIGQTGNVINFSIDRLSLLDKPDITWDEKEAEQLHTNLRKAFELDDRFASLQFKVDYLRDSSKTVLEVLQDRKAAVLEWIIIILIAAEFIFFIVAEM